MKNNKVKLTFANNKSLLLKPDTVIYVYNSDYDDIKTPYASGGMFYTLSEHSHSDAGFIPFLVGLLGSNDFFCLDSDNVLENTLYQCSSVVSIDHVKENDVTVQLFKHGI